MNDTDRPEKSTELTPEEIRLITAYRSNPREYANSLIRFSCRKMKSRRRPKLLIREIEQQLPLCCGLF